MLAWNGLRGDTSTSFYVLSRTSKRVCGLLSRKYMNSRISERDTNGLIGQGHTVLSGMVPDEWGWQPKGFRGYDDGPWAILISGYARYIRAHRPHGGGGLDGIGSSLWNASTS